MLRVLAIFSLVIGAIGVDHDDHEGMGVTVDSAAQFHKADAKMTRKVERHDSGTRVARDGALMRHDARPNKARTPIAQLTEQIANLSKTANLLQGHSGMPQQHGTRGSSVSSTDCKLYMSNRMQTLGEEKKYLHHGESDGQLKLSGSTGKGSHWFVEASARGKKKIMLKVENGKYTNKYLHVGASDGFLKLSGSTDEGSDWKWIQGEKWGKLWSPRASKYLHVGSPDNVNDLKLQLSKSDSEGSQWTPIPHSCN